MYISNALPMPARRTQAILLFLLVVIAAGLLGYRSIDDLDYGIHVATGRWIIEHGRVPTTDPFTWSIPEHAYVAYHWGFQVLLAGLYEKFSHVGPVCLRFVFVVAIAAAVGWAFFVRKVDPIIGGLCGLLALLASEVRFSIRPELFTYLFLALTVLTLDRWRAGSTKALYAIPLIFVGWVNTHIYILGFVLLFAELVEQIALRRVSRQFCIVVALTLVAIFVNPYGLEAVMEPIRLFTRMSKENIFAQHITELTSPLAIESNSRTPFMLTAQFGAWFCLLALTVPAFFGLLRARRIADILVMVSFAALSCLAVRNMALFAIAASPAIAYGLTHIASRQSKLYEAFSRVAFTALIVVAIVLSIRVASGAWYASQRRTAHFAGIVERSALAIDAAEFVEKSALKGRGFNNLDVGGALLLEAPSHPIFIDGRNEVTGEAFFRSYLEILEPKRSDSFIESFTIEYVVLGHSNTLPLIRHLIASNKWTVAHYDAVAVVLVRKDGSNGHLPAMLLPAPIANDEERWRYLSSINIRPNVIDSVSRWLLGGEEVPRDKDRLGTFLLMAGRWAEAERPLLEAAVRAPNFWETSHNLGALYMRLGKWEVATLAYRNVLMLNPSNAMAREREKMSWFKFKQMVSVKES